ncbi:valine--tRNA ligase, mitochondrial [Alligator mississippiensis]|uniref:Valine--tRNA ligase, mitochondrial n=1 Tax=Alligator mississippiensis TaxID=8496 RepID=A0A151M5Z1_ALLMI|nr:valine--tRNA ligase, mitochondrial [Alligator mississippiensis]KYO19901.1 valine--tRNA ligase [Alligator mississippiensis]
MLLKRDGSIRSRCLSSLHQLLQLWTRPGPWAIPPGWRASSDSRISAQNWTQLKNKAEKQKRQHKRLESIEAGVAQKSAVPQRRSKAWVPKDVVLYDIPTAPGQKKDTSVPLPASYSPRYVEAAWYSWWEKEGFFKPEYQSQQPQRKAETFSLCIPPPNVTGSLHLGHALTVAIEDALVRWHRMRGDTVLWVPGSDHAGIATQAVVERKIWKERGARRQDLTRGEFFSEVWKWKEEKGNEIFQQLKALGASLDWDRACFTMDSGFSEAVTEAFVRLHEDGLVYRAQRVVNWSCALRSVISDIEVENRQLQGHTMLSVPGCPAPVPFGVMVTFAYKVEGEEDQELTVATTRPETMLGDVAVAVHPNDPRYLHLHGKMVQHPFTGRLLPIIVDPMVEQDMETGAMKVTPAHSRADYELGKVHGLPLISVIGEDGSMTAECGDWLQGLNRFLARDKVVSALKEKGLLRSMKGHAMVLPLCSRSGDVVEYLLKSQWFLRCEGMAQRALDAVALGHLKFTPKFHEKNWSTWLSNISDWCISRQLWWGHQIPAYQVPVTQSRGLEKDENGVLWVVGRTEAEARKKAAGILRKPEEEVELVRDPDVLDTWFSSALFPFAALGWPHQTSDLQNFYPNSLLETGSDLLFFWVARMVMLGQQLTGKLPFSQVFLHSIVHDAHGRKMSKSLGNVIDPLDFIHGATLQDLQGRLHGGHLDPLEAAIAAEGQKRDFPQGIPECGTDALRFSLCSHNVQGDDINLDVDAVLSSRLFCNKVWNAVKFTLKALGEGFTPQAHSQVFPCSLMEQWILSHLYNTVAYCDQWFGEYEFHCIISAIHSFWLNKFCSVYLESVKPVLSSGDQFQILQTCQTLLTCTDLGLRLLSPFMPYLTEELWQRLPKPDTGSFPSVCVASYPCADQLAHWHNPEEEANFLLVEKVIQTVRNLKMTYQLINLRLPVFLLCLNPASRVVYEEYRDPLQTLSQAGSLKLLSCPSEVQPLTGWVGSRVNDHTEVYLEVKGLVDPKVKLTQLASQKQKLEHKLSKLMAQTQTQASNYQEKASQATQAENWMKISNLQRKLANLDEAMDRLHCLAVIQGTHPLTTDK